MKSVDVPRTLKTELNADIPCIERQKYELIYDKLSEIEPDEFEYVAPAYAIVNLYNLIDNYLK